MMQERRSIGPAAGLNLSFQPTKVGGISRFIGVLESSEHKINPEIFA